MIRGYWGSGRSIKVAPEASQGTRIWTVFLFFLHFSVFAPLCFSAPAPIQPADYGLTIATRSDGTHALIFLESGGVLLWIWTNDVATGREVKLNLDVVATIHWPAIEFLDSDKLIIVDSSWNYTCGKVYTVSLTNGAKLEEFAFGDQYTRWGTSIKLSSGGYFFVNYNHNTPNIVWDVCYRKPPQPPSLLAFPSSPWVTNRYTFKPVNGEIPSSNLGVAEDNGLIDAFCVRDSAGMLARMKFKEIPSGITNVYYKGDYLSMFQTNGVADAYVPDGENPQICVRTDRQNNRAVLMYALDYGRTIACGSIFDLAGITFADSYYTSTLINKTPYRMERVSLPACFVRPDAIYYVQMEKNLTNCVGSFIYGSSASGKIRDIDVVNFYATSVDGWMAYYALDGWFKIVRLPFRPNIKIDKSTVLTRAQVMALAAQAQKEPLTQSFVAPQNMSIDSDEKDPGTLESTVDLKKWKVYSSITNWPVLIPQTNQQQFFRTRQP